MKKLFRFQLLIIFLCVSQSIFSQKTAILWEVKHPQNKKTSYIFGSIHIQDKRVFGLDTTVWNKFDRAEAFVMEVELDKVEPMQVAQAMTMPQSYKELLSDEDYQLLNTFFTQNFGAGLDMIGNIKPFFLAAQITQTFIPKDEELPMDLYFLRKAREEQKQVYQLEAFEDQIAAADKIPVEKQIQELIDLAKNENFQAELEKEMHELISAYLKQDSELLWNISKKEAQNEDFIKYMLIDRNYKMADRIHELAQKSSLFALFGAGHLGGPEGVIKLLEKKGYTLTPLEVTFKNNK